MDPVVERRTGLLTSAFTSPLGVMPALLQVIEYLTREAKAEAWDEGWYDATNGKWGPPDPGANPYRD